MIKKFLTILLAVTISLSATACSVKKEYKKFSTYVFGNGITFSANLMGGDEAAAFEEMKTLLADINGDMSVSLSSSAISRFNEGNVGIIVEVSGYTYDVIKKSIQIYNESSRAFNIAVPQLSRLWNVDAEGMGKYGGISPEPPPPPPSIEEVERLKEFSNLDGLKLIEDDGKYYIEKLSANLKLDFGAIAKGYGAEECAEIAKKHGIESGLINISGNLCLVGDWYYGGEFVDWEVGITAPRPRSAFGGVVCAVKTAGNSTLVTSGDYERFYTYVYEDGYALNVCHIINPFTGMPIGIKYNDELQRYENTTDGVISATVIATDSAQADAYATAICVLGYEKGVKLLKDNGLKGVIITEDGKMALVGVKENAQEGVHLTQTDKFDEYKKYKLEEL